MFLGQCADVLGQCVGDPFFVTVCGRSFFWDSVWEILFWGSVWEILFWGSVWEILLPEQGLRTDLLLWSGR